LKTHSFVIRALTIFSEFTVFSELRKGGYGFGKCSPDWEGLVRRLLSLCKRTASAAAGTYSERYSNGQILTMIDGSTFAFNLSGSAVQIKNQKELSQ